MDQTIDHDQVLLALRRDTIVSFVVVFQRTPDAPEHRSKCTSRASRTDLQIFGLAHGGQAQLSQAAERDLFDHLPVVAYAHGWFTLFSLLLSQSNTHGLRTMPSRRSHLHVGEDQLDCHIASATCASVAFDPWKRERRKDTLEHSSIKQKPTFPSSSWSWISSACLWNSFASAEIGHSAFVVVESATTNERVKEMHRCRSDVHFVGNAFVSDTLA